MSRKAINNLLNKLLHCLDPYINRQLFPFATRSQIFDHVGECVEELYLKDGGLCLNVELNYETSIENCAAILEALEKYRHYKR